ncbi:class I adenylate-forming enzyme family protein [Pseudonocardia yunnanensis]|uniref:Class I adenylate-forming enzyme family protein n=1 Tax=Pseudonocardia yunnanensis TaxID=58107 RepID=A0ABW4EPX3_9PSEU
MASTRDDALARLIGPGGPFEIREQDVLGVQVRAYQVGPHTLTEVLEASRVWGNRDYLVYDDERYTYEQHYDVVAGLAHHLAENYGIGPGDRIVIAMRNYPEFPLFFWAAQALGAVAVLLNAWWTEHELQFGLDDSEGVFLVVDRERLERMQRIIPAARRLRGVVSVRTEQALDGVVPFAEMRKHLQAGLTLRPVEIDTDDLATILYTSGTTGRARGAMHSHRNHCTNLLNAQLNGAIAAEMAGIEPDLEPAPQRGGLAHMPLFHISQLSSLYIGMAAGSKSVLMYRWDAERALELIERERLTSFGGVPLQVQGLFDSPSLNTRDLSSLESFGFAATAIAPEKVLRVQKLFGGRVAAGTGYGMTEATSAVTLIGGQEYWEHPDSVGRPTPVNDIKIVDELGDEVPTGEVGELWVKGPNIVRGYWRSPEATALAFSDGWHHSGDVARVDDEGRVYLVDRIKDVVIRAGENVYCGEVEAVLYDHPAVHTAAVFGLPHERLGEEVAAVVRLADGYGSTTAEELQAHTAERLARFKVPSRIEFITEDVPRTATGKIMKRALRDGLVGSSGTGQAAGR